KAWRWPLHRPIVKAALDAGLRVRAANLSRADARRIASQDTKEAVDPDLLRDMMEGHCGAIPETAAAGMVRAQGARDAAMAHALEEARPPAVLIAGNGHVRRDRGVPRYLPADAQALSVGFLETRAGESDPRAYVQGAKGELLYDYAWFTAPQPRADPCEAM